MLKASHAHFLSVLKRIDRDEKWNVFTRVLQFERCSTSDHVLSSDWLILVVALCALIFSVSHCAPLLIPRRAYTQIQTNKQQMEQQQCTSNTTMNHHWRYHIMHICALKYVYTTHMSHTYVFSNVHVRIVYIYTFRNIHMGLWICMYRYTSGHDARTHVKQYESEC